MSMSGPIERLFLRSKPVHALLAVAEAEMAYATEVARRIGSTLPHTSSILSELEAHGLISSRPQGRVRYLELTERGRRMAIALRDLLALLEGPQEQWRRLERLKVAASLASGRPDAALRLGPLRRDLAKLQAEGDEEIRMAAGELDSEICGALRS